MKNYFNDYLDAEDEGCKKTNVAFGILGKDFDIDLFSEKIGINPSHSFKMGDVHKTKRGTLIKRPYSLWNYDSELKSKSTNVNKHLIELLKVFENKVDIIEKFKIDEKLRVYITIQWESKDGYGGYVIKSSLINRISRLCNELDLNFS